MIDNRALADQFRRSMFGEAWHGPSVFEALEGVNAARALQRTIPGGHNIWEIVLHLTLWVELTSGALRGDRLPPDEANDWPPVGSTDDAEWDRARERLRSAATAAITDISQFPDSAIRGVVPGRTYRFEFLLQGVPQHNCYHAGQIAILKKG